MKKEDKELLLKDLCARLPYGVKVHAKYIDIDTNTEVEKVGVLNIVDNDKVIAFTCDDTKYYNYVAIHEVKPYLFPLSSMTEEQKTSHNFLKHSAYASPIKLIDFYNKNHFDYRGLIPKGMAIDCTNLNIY